MEVTRVLGDLLPPSPANGTPSSNVDSPCKKVISASPWPPTSWFRVLFLALIQLAGFTDYGIRDYGHVFCCFRAHLQKRVTLRRVLFARTSQTPPLPESGDGETSLGEERAVPPKEKTGVDGRGGGKRTQ